MSEQPDVVYVVERYPELTQTFVIDELREVAARGIRIRVFSLDAPIVEHPPVPGIDVIRLQPLGAASGRLRGAVLRAATRRPFGVARALRHRQRVGPERDDQLWFAIQAALHLGRDRPHRVHAHFANRPAGVAMRLAQILGVPFSFQAHGIDVWTNEQDLAIHLEQADVAFAPCETYRTHLLSVQPGANVVTVPVGVDTNMFHRSRAWERGEVPNLLIVGRLVEKKGHALLLTAIAKLGGAGVHVGLTVIGDGPLGDELEAQAAALGIEQQLTFLGARDRDQIRASLERATLFVLPCMVASNGDRDSQPVALKEAMSMEVPVISTREVGIPELVDAASGVLVAAGDPSALADAVAELLVRSDEELRAMGRAGRRRVEAGFAHSVTIPALIQAWRL